jgi:hypothetical protein
MQMSVVASKPRMASRRVGAFLLLYQGTQAPSTDEWDHCLSLLRGFGAELKDARVLVMTRGGGPTPDQRKRLAKVLGKLSIRVAVVTSSIKVHFITSSVAFIIPRIHSFTWDHLPDAYAHLGMTLREQDVAESHLAEMRAYVGE